MHRWSPKGNNKHLKSTFRTSSSVRSFCLIDKRKDLICLNHIYQPFINLEPFNRINLKEHNIILQHSLRCQDNLKGKTKYPNQNSDMLAKRTVLPSMISLVEWSTGVGTTLLLPSEAACSFELFSPTRYIMEGHGSETIGTYWILYFTIAIKLQKTNNDLEREHNQENSNGVSSLNSRVASLCQWR